MNDLNIRTLIIETIKHINYYDKDWFKSWFFSLYLINDTDTKTKWKKFNYLTEKWMKISDKNYFKNEREKWWNKIFSTKNDK